MSKRCVMLNAIRNVTKTSSYASGAGAATFASSTKPINTFTAYKTGWDAPFRIWARMPACVIASLSVSSATSVPALIT